MREEAERIIAEYHLLPEVKNSIDLAITSINPSLPLETRISDLADILIAIDNSMREDKLKYNYVENKYNKLAKTIDTYKASTNNVRELLKIIHNDFSDIGDVHIITSLALLRYTYFVNSDRLNYVHLNTFKQQYLTKLFTNERIELYGHILGQLDVHHKLYTLKQNLEKYHMMLTASILSEFDPQKTCWIDQDNIIIKELVCIENIIDEDIISKIREYIPKANLIIKENRVSHVCSMVLNQIHSKLIVKDVEINTEFSGTDSMRELFSTAKSFYNYREFLITRKLKESWNKFSST